MVGKQAKPNVKPAQPNLHIAAPPNPLQPEFLHGRVSPAGEAVRFLSFRADLFPGGSESSVIVPVLFECRAQPLPWRRRGPISAKTKSAPIPGYSRQPAPLRERWRKSRGYGRRSWQAARGLGFYIGHLDSGSALCFLFCDAGQNRNPSGPAGIRVGYRSARNDGYRDNGI